MATNTNSTAGGLTGIDAELAAQPRMASLLGGLQEGFSGVGAPLAAHRAAQPSADGGGVGELLEVDDGAAFQAVHGLVLRQEQLARNRLQQDKHFTYQKLGFAWSTLEKSQNQDVYTQTFPPGTESLRPASVPNKAADLANKLTETLLVDLALPAPVPADDSEQAVQGAEFARQFLMQDGTEAGTADGEIFWAQVEGATSRASTFNHYWVDPYGGGPAPLQIRAHPRATDPAHPLDAPDGSPTTDYILRYVTDDEQFTDDPAKAKRTWIPKIIIEKWGREHLRLFPEDQDIHGCQSVVGLFYTTLGTARRRWPTVAAMDASEQGQLCDWTPPRYLALLPPALRARWKLQTGNPTDPRGSSNDERVLFFYCFYRKSDPDYPKGAVLCTSGAMGGRTLEKGTLSADVHIPSQDRQDQMVTESRPLDIPIVQIRLIQDADEKDPTGTAFMRRIGGAGEAATTLANGYLEAIDTILHPARFATATSPVTDADVQESRALGSFATVLSKDDFPQYEQPRPLPPNFFNSIDWMYEQMDSAASLNRAAQGSDRSQEVSGVARKIAVNQAMVSMSRMQQALQQAWERHWRIKLQLAMAHFTAPWLLRYVGEDGAYKQEWVTGNSFARVGRITMQSGTGTMMPPQEKVNYVTQLLQQRLIDPDEAADIARPAFASALGVPPNPHAQRIERQVSAWLEGPPSGWVEQYQQYQQAKAAYAAQQQQMQQQQQQAQQQQAAAAQQQAQQQQQQATAGHQQQQQQAQEAQQQAQHAQKLQHADEAHREALRMARETHGQALHLAAARPQS